MARAYSEDLRERFCRALDRGMSARAAARQLEVSASTGVKWAQRWRATGSLSAKPMGGRKPVVLMSERDWLLARLERECDPTLAALVAALREERGIEVCRDTLWRFLKRCGKSFKKRRSSPRSRIDRTSSAAAPAGSGFSAG
jgi:transposase